MYIYIYVYLYIYVSFNAQFSDLFFFLQGLDGIISAPDIPWVRGLAYNVTLQGQQLLELQEHRLAPQPRYVVMFFLGGQ